MHMSVFNALVPFSTSEHVSDDLGHPLQRDDTARRPRTFGFAIAFELLRATTARHPVVFGRSDTFH